ncbi:MAG: YwbE family protein [Eubacteriaceae bacterium]
MDSKNRSNIKIGMLVDIVLKEDQKTGKLTRGHVKRILTNSEFHPHGIKVMLEENNMVGRVQKIIE